MDINTLNSIPQSQFEVNVPEMRPCKSRATFFTQENFATPEARTVERGVTRVVTRGPGALRGPVENKVCIFGYEFSISSIGRAGP